MRLIVPLIFLTILSVSAFCQTQISGIINQYAAVTAYDACNNEFSLSSISGFEPGMKVIIIQMQGAQINTSNDASFGNITSIGQAGKYETAEILTVSPGGIVLKHFPVNTYDFNGKVQVVSLPEYDAAYVNGTLTCASWNGQTGGVLALKVSGQLITDANIDVSGKGFRGGISDVAGTNNCSFITNANDYFYEQSNWRGAPKGEGIAMIIANHENGRGAQANGGGGGNDHNSGGGGGSNLTAGGQGGENNEPSTFGCDGAFPGRGGKAVTAAADRIFMGGGGGAGHENNGVGTNGGNGGGIVFIIADEFMGTGYTIQANGNHAETAAGDGAGGGGGGGTIIFNVLSASGYHFEATGGNGGNANNGNADRCLGPGGGGSGGRIMAAAVITVPPTGISGGLAGTSLNSTACSNSNNGATSGTTGIIETLDNLVSGNEPFAPTAIIGQPEVVFACEGENLLIAVEAEGVSLSYQWQLDDGNGFENITNALPFSGANTALLQVSTIDAGFNNYQFRLIVSSECFDDVISSPIPLVVAPLPQAQFTFMAEDLTVNFENLSTGANTFSWNFGDSQQSVENDPEHTFLGYGTYVVMLTASNDCSQDTFVMEISLLVPIVAGFHYSDAGGCAPFEVQFSNASTGTYDQLEWIFPGGTPVSSTEENPLVVYVTPGIYDVSLTASGSAGENTFTFENLVEILPPPTPAFTWEVLDDLTVSFTNNSQNALNYNWVFGDGSTSTATDPIHEYAAPGDYEVTLNAQNIYCGVSLSQGILLVTALETPDLHPLNLFPNPVEHSLYLEWEFARKLKVQITTIQGEVVYKNDDLHNNSIDVSRLASGLYFFEFEHEGGSGQFKFIKL